MRVLIEALNPKKERKESLIGALFFAQNQWLFKDYHF